MTLLEINFQRRKVRVEAAALLDTAIREARTLSIVEAVRFDALTERVHELDAAYDARESLRKLAN